MTGFEALGYSLVYAYVFLGLGYLIRKLNRREDDASETS